MAVTALKYLQTKFVSEGTLSYDVTKLHITYFDTKADRYRKENHMYIETFTECCALQTGMYH